MVNYFILLLHSKQMPPSGLFEMLKDISDSVFLRPHILQRYLLTNFEDEYLGADRSMATEKSEYLSSLA